MLRRQKHVLLQSTTPFACTNISCNNHNQRNQDAHKMRGVHKMWVANPPLRWPDSRESIRRVPDLNPFFCESRFGGAQTNRRFKAIRANRSHTMEIGFFLRIDSCESIRANRRDSRCESPRAEVKCGKLWKFSSKAPFSPPPGPSGCLGGSKHKFCGHLDVAHTSSCVDISLTSYRIEKPRYPENRRKVDRILLFAYSSRILPILGLLNSIFPLFSGFLGFFSIL